MNTSIEELHAASKKHGFSFVYVPLGGTIAMSRNEHGQLESVEDSCFTSQTLADFIKNNPDCDPVQNAAQFARLLVEKIASYAGGVRLDSSELYDGGGIFAATLCGYVFPQIAKAVTLVIQEKNIPEETALKNLLVVITLGTDRHAELNAFFDFVAYQTGCTFITVGANSSAYFPNSDAKTNLKTARKVVELLGSGKLPRGVAYGVADGLVMTMMVKKMKPTAASVEQSVLAPDGKRYGGTFLAIHTRTIEEIEHQGWFFSETRKTDLFFSKLVLSDWKIHEKVEKAAALADALVAIQTFALLSPDIPQSLRKNTAGCIVQCPGQGNAPPYAAQILSRLTRDSGVFLIALCSEAGWPHLGQEYASAAILQLRQTPELADRLINCHALPDFIVRHVLTTALFQAKENNEYLTASSVQQLLDDYGNARNV
ncbi:MAG: asparaginase domain-containing protein [bacterium]